jgi:hypothetical protein
MMANVVSLKETPDEYLDSKLNREYDELIKDLEESNLRLIKQIEVLTKRLEKQKMVCVSVKGMKGK